ncbi:MAG: hypothetical protein ACETWB_02185 [Anaerolineae bacterium]
MPEIVNPYITNRPIGEKELFFGREDVFSWVVESLSRGQRVLVLYGPRRIGKSSFLRQLPHRLPSNYVPLLLSLRPRGRTDQDVLLRQVAIDVIRKLREEGWVFLPEPQWEDFDGQASSLADRLLGEAGMKLGGQTLVLIFDDIEPLLTHRRGDELFWSFAVHLSTRLDRSPNLRLIFALEKRESLKREAFSLFDRALYRQLGSLNREGAGALITEPAEGILNYDPVAVRRILELTSNHPYFIQLFCYLLFNRCARTGEYVTPRDVEVVLDELLHLEIDYFEGLWETSSPQEKVVLAALGLLRGAHGIATRQEVGNALRKQAVPIAQTEVDKALEALAQRGILERLGALSYRFSVDLFRVWLSRRKGIEEVMQSIQKLAESRTMLPRSPREFSLAALVLVVAVALVFGLRWLLWPAEPESQRQAMPQVIPSPTVFTPLAEAKKTSTPTVAPTATRPLVVARSIPSIAYMVKVKPDSPWQIYVMDSNGANPLRLTQTESNETAPVWSPDGSQIVFVSDRDGDRDTYVMNNDGTESRNLTENAADDLMPVWSPDGNEIAFVSHRDGNWEIYIMKADGSDPVRITDNEADDWAPAWSPDGTEIAFATNRDGNWEIYVMNRDGSQPLPLTRNSATDISPSWSPRGDRIAFESTRDGDAEIYVMGIDGTGQANLTLERTADDHWPSWSPDGGKIVFCSNRGDGDWDIYVMTDRGTDVVNLSEGSLGNEQGPAWRP